MKTKRFRHFLELIKTKIMKFVCQYTFTFLDTFNLCLFFIVAQSTLFAIYILSSVFNQISNVYLSYFKYKKKM